jgi:transposase
MIIIGVDYHPEFQQLASVETDTGEFREERLQNREQAEQFYRELSGPGARRIGMEASGHARWLERVLRLHGHRMRPLPSSVPCMFSTFAVSGGFLSVADLSS